MKFIKKVCNKLKNKYYRARLHYLNYYRKLPIDEKLILLESQNGNTINGNIFYILKELTNNEKYKEYKIKLVVANSKCNSTSKFLSAQGISGYEIVTLATKPFFKILASAKYLITDMSMTPNYIKKDGQVLINTWHGTPLKTLGKKVRNEPHAIGNVQKNFIQADFLLYPNEFMKQHMIEDYMLENLSDAKVLLSGYPRNTIFFDKNYQKEVRSELNLDDKQIIVYMPTWRGSVSNVEKEISNTYISYYLLEIDSLLTDDQVMFVNLHPFVSSAINYKLFRHIKPFPKRFETYQFLSIADCLITDYSSVFFDFANTRRKIILFTYDEEKYLADRGMYLKISDLPFPSVKSVDELIREINTPIAYDDSEFIEKFCKYESKNATKYLLERTILGHKTPIVEEEIAKNGKENVLIYVGNLAKNGITSSVKNLLSSIDLNKYNYYITFMTKNVSKYKDILFELPPAVKYIPMPSGTNGTLKDKIFNFLFNKGIIKAKLYMKLENSTLRDEIKRLYGSIKFSTVIQFNGYEKRNILLFSLFDSNTVIYVHSDMIQEVKVRKNQRSDVLKYAYSNYDKIACVTRGMIHSTLQFADSIERIHIANNIINYKDVIDKSKQDIAIDPDTELNVEYETLVSVLEDKKSKKFITIGRFSKEKGHDRLINAFNRFYIKNKNSYLIIIGGHGNEFNNINQKISQLESRDNIILIKSISNPYTILNKCDYFVLPSLYEGFGLVLAEADILGKPLVSTDIEGPRDFILNNKGILVENSEEGIYKGLKMLYKDKISPMNVDYKVYNEGAIEQFEELLKAKY